jgi:hypothetical protein
MNIKNAVNNYITYQMDSAVIPCSFRGNDRTLSAFFSTVFVTDICMWFPVAFLGNYWSRIFQQAKGHDNFYQSPLSTLDPL